MFQERIRRIYAILPPSHRVIADFLLNAYQEAAFMSGSQLAQHLQVDPATVVRFSQRLGYSGYPELRREMQARVRKEIQARYQPITVEGSAGDLFRKLIHNYQELLGQAIVLDATKSISDIVSHTARSKRVYVLSEGVGLYIGELFAALLRQQGIAAQAVAPDTRSIAEAMHDVGREDMVIGLLADDEYTEMATGIRFARDHGAFTAALVRDGSTALARAAETVVVCPQAEPADLSHLACTVTLILVIAHMLAARDARAAGEKRASQVRKALDELSNLKHRIAGRHPG
ncbi:MAG: MurR/RpiR family transcriptional regulator [Anaerolineae bacterium]|nr:MurR/RpiR family transcriptional regulator [Anaerolineae bacterium]